MYLVVSRYHVITIQEYKIKNIISYKFEIESYCKLLQKYKYSAF